MSINIPLEERFLENGLRVVIAPNHRAPLACVSIGYKVGSKDETVDKTGFAHLFEHLMFDGSTHVGRGEYDVYVSKVGGQCNAYTSYDQTIYHEELPIAALEMGLWLESDRMLECGVKPIGLETQQKVILEEFSQVVENQPYGRWRIAQSAAAFTPDCSYSWETIGKREHIVAATMDDVRDFYSMYYRPDNACVVIAGDISFDKGFSLADKYFGEIEKRNSPIRRNVFTKEHKRYGQHSIITDSVPLPAVYISFHCEGVRSDATLSADMYSGIMGSGRSSRLYKALVDETQIASTVWAFADTREHTSLLTLHATAASPDITTDTLAEHIFNQLEKLQKDGLLAHEMEKTRNSVATSHAAALQTSSGVADALTNYVLLWDNPHEINSSVDKYFSVSNQDVMDFSHNYMNPSQAIRTDVVPMEE